MHILIISHVPLSGTYGAATSIRNHIQFFSCNPEIKFTVIEQIGYHSGPRVNVSLNVVRKSWLLPIIGNYDGYIDGTFRKIYYFVRKILSFLFVKRLLNKIEAIKPDVIHINSLVLSELVRWLRSDKRFNETKIIASVREVLSPNLKKNDLDSICLIDSFICIDKATMESLLQYPVINFQNIIIQHNPFILTDRLWTRHHEFKSQFKCIFSISGIITQDKGVLEVVQSFIEVHESDSVLLVVGGAKNKYSRSVINLCNTSKNVYYLGEIPDLCASGFFNTIDVLIRGDDSFRTGRTVYEALYSGAIAILPCRESEYLGDEQIENFLDNVTFYRPKNLSSLKSAIQSSRLLVLNRKRKASYFLPDISGYKKMYKNIYAINSLNSREVDQ